MNFENKEELFEALDNMLDEKKFQSFIQTVDEMNPIDTADYMSTLKSEKLLTAFRLLKKNIAVDVFAELDPDTQESIILTTTDRELATLVDELYVDDAVDMLEELPAGMVKRILRAARPETRVLINRFLSYPEDSAGSVMTAEYIDLRKEMTVAEAIQRIRQTGVDKETVYTAYVTDTSRVLEGIVSLKDLLFADPDEKIEEIMETGILYAHTLDDRESAAITISKYDLLALPVVDKEMRLVGIVTVDDAIDVMEEEATEDIEAMAAITPTDKPYLKTSVFEVWKKRIPWLLLLMVSATFTGAIIQYYEDALNGLFVDASLGSLIIITSFIPMIMGTGGNAGGQSSVTIIRGLSLEEIEMKDIWLVLWKELRISLLCAATLFAATFVKIMLLDLRCSFTPQNLLIAFAVSLTLFFTVVVAKVIGCALPVLAKRIKLDPAVMASPFITTIVDALSLIIYFQIVSAVFG